MQIRKFNPKTGEWELESKKDVMKHKDMEGNSPCDKCWEDARDNGVYAWPLKIPKRRFLRCECGRMIGVKPKAE